MKCGVCSLGVGPESCTHWRGDKLRAEPSAETTIALSQIHVNGVCVCMCVSERFGLYKSLFVAEMATAFPTKDGVFVVGT